MKTKYWMKLTDGKIREFAEGEEELADKMYEHDLAWCDECGFVVEPVAAYRPWDLDQCPFCGQDVEG